MDRTVRAASSSWGLPSSRRERAWVRTPPSWDRLIMPIPFSRVAVAFGQPTPVPRGLSGAELESVRVRLETELNRTTSLTEIAALPNRPHPVPATG